MAMPCGGPLPIVMGASARWLWLCASARLCHLLVTSSVLTDFCHAFFPLWGVTLSNFVLASCPSPVL